MEESKPGTVRQNLVYDIECLKGFFCVVFEDFASDELTIFEISERQNDRKELIKFVKGKGLMGFNNLAYDSQILQYIINKDCTNE